MAGPRLELLKWIDYRSIIDNVLLIVNNMSPNKKRVLVIDDEQPFLDIMQEKLCKEGLEPLLAKGGEEGINLALKEHPDVIVLDILMPGMDGWSVYDRLRRDNCCKTVPIIILTNVTDKSRQEQSKKCGAYEYMIKADSSLEEVIKKIKEKAGI